MGNPFTPKSSLKVALKCNLKSAKKCPRMKILTLVACACPVANSWSISKRRPVLDSSRYRQRTYEPDCQKNQFENFVFFQDV